MAKIFISHSSKDKRFVRTLKEDLQENNIETWFDEDQLDIGDSLIEKIEDSLEESTHFLIVLSPNSVSSDWVKLELNKAIQQVSKKLMNKIIPIQYRNCDIPKELKGLVYYDLSKEVVQVVDAKVKFTTDGYPLFLNKLVNTIKATSEKKLTHSDKLKFREELVETEKESLAKRELIATLVLEVSSFSTTETRSEYMQRIMSKSPTEINPNAHIKPVLLPRILKNIFKTLSIGDELNFSSDISELNSIGHFAGFRRDDIRITIPRNLRNELVITNGGAYVVRFDGNTNSVIILREVK